MVDTPTRTLPVLDMDQLARLHARPGGLQAYLLQWEYQAHRRRLGLPTEPDRDELLAWEAAWDDFDA